MKKPYSDRGARKILARYTRAADITASISRTRCAISLFTWFKTQGADHALIRSFSGRATRQSLGICPPRPRRCQLRNDQVIGNFPV